MFSWLDTLPMAIKGLSKWLNRCLVALMLCALSLTNIASAAIIDVIYVGTWDTVADTPNSTANGGPGMSVGQKYVIKFSYDDTSTVTNNVAVKDLGFNDTNKSMSTIDLSAAGNSLDIFVPMEGLDAGSPFIYQQDQSNHFDFGDNSPVPTLNFANGSDISDKNNIIGLEYEGDFAGAGFNFIQLFNTATDTSATSMEAKAFNCMDANCIGGQVASTSSNNSVLNEAVELVVDAGPDIVYNAATLIQTATASVTQSNDLGAARSDGEDFVGFTWSETGTVIGDSIQVGIAASGLSMTTSTATWTANGTEEMTGKSDSDTTNVSYDNATPTLNASATVNGTDIDFTFNAGDADLAVNALIAGFESLSFAALINGATNATAFFADLFSSGAFSYSMADLTAAFGGGNHNVLFSVTDKAGFLSDVSFDFDVTTVVNPPTIPEPSAIVLMLAGLLILWRKYSSRPLI
ncbi:hypothetical protein [Thalassotalea atypica]|uniref:hypothetical protein n=1 Tax=Thalassotalea atypica TaxID=2054316 RepID=UPI0025736B03|nr:hypothetical protein [Thalassotalea atypica]